MSLSEALALTSLILWGILTLLPWLPWRNREVLNAETGQRIALEAVTVVIPARNEADVIEGTLEGLARQSEHLKVILVDDHSEDGTAERAAKSRLKGLEIIQAKPLPAGWSGKLWAQNQGMERVATPMVLLLDADIYLDDGMLTALLHKKKQQDLHFVSLMAQPSLKRFWERALMPAFVYFFKLLYPFALSNSGSPHFAAAAGGCMLLDTGIVARVGGLESIRGAVIDDCSFARRIKAQGFRIWTGLTRNVHSQRPYESLNDIWNMVARTAYTQLRYSNWLLGLCTLLMGLMFIFPVLGLVLGNPTLTLYSALALGLMITTYLPTLRFYQLNPLWAPGLPVIAVLYLAMTWTSAWRYWNGETSRWKNRVYSREQTQNPN